MDANADGVIDRLVIMASKAIRDQSLIDSTNRFTLIGGLSGSSYVPTGVGSGSVANDNIFELLLNSLLIKAGTGPASLSLSYSDDTAPVLGSAITDLLSNRLIAFTNTLCLDGECKYQCL